MSTVEPPSLGRYLLGCVIMLAGVVAPLALAFLKTTRRGPSYTRGLGCVPPTGLRLLLGAGIAQRCLLRLRLAPHL